MNFEYDCLQKAHHPFAVGDYVRSKTKPEYGIGKVVELLGGSNLYVEFENTPDKINYHWQHLELTSDRPLTAKEKVLDALRTEQERLRTERADYLHEVDEKIRKLTVALNAVDAVEL